jgi:predicted metal-dependent phosphoesterase TrpH
MPNGQPFTALCQAATRKPTTGRSDLHIHSTYSDGLYTPAKVVDLARRSGLAAIAITDHDTLDGITPAQQAATGSTLEIVPGVEITSHYHGRELHLLGYFIRPDDAPLREALDRLRAERADRFWELVEYLQRRGVALPEAALERHRRAGVLGRRHLAEMLVQSGQAGSVREAFHRYLREDTTAAVPRLRRLPVADAIALVLQAGGVAGWAHPSYDCNRETVAELRRIGLGALEAAYPTFPPKRVRELRALAAEFGLAVTSGSDCHGPEPLRRAVGASSMTNEELEALRSRASD